MNTLELASIDQQITRTTAMLESCTRNNAPAAAIETLMSRLTEYHTERGMILKGSQPVDERRAQLRESGREFQATAKVDPDQQDNVSWWAS
jgi:hypothetical protein